MQPIVLLNNLSRIVMVAVVVSTLIITTAAAETRVTYKSASSSSSYYQMAVQLAEAVKAGTDGNIIVTVEESQGSVQNVKEVAQRTGNYVFTTPPALVKLAMAGENMFKDASPNYQNIRSLFPIPSLTMHLVVSGDSGIEDFAGLADKKFLIGKGSFGADEAAKYIDMFGLKDQVDLIDVDLGSAVSALKNGQIDGFATAGSYPAPNVLEAAAGGDIRLLSLSDEQIAQSKRTKLVIPAGTYPGVDYDVSTTSLPVGAYTTTGMDDDTAYQLTKTFWQQKDKMSAAGAWWNAVTIDGLDLLGAKLHPGALKYYQEAGSTVPQPLME
jgi:TRAP transporter TAXI family solute receptor